MIKDIKYIKVWERHLERTTGTFGTITTNGKWVYNPSGVIDVFESAIFNSSFGGRGDFELTIPYNAQNLRLLHLDSDAEREKFVASKTAVTGHNYISLSLYLTIDSVNDIFCVEKITYERNDNGALFMVLSGSNGIGLMDGLFLGQTRAFTKTVDGTTMTVPAITGRQCLIGDYNTSSGGGFGIAYPNLVALVADGWRNPALGDEQIASVNHYASLRGYRVEYNETGFDRTKKIVDVNGNKTTPSFSPSKVSTLVLDMCAKYCLGFEYTFVEMDEGQEWQAVITVKDAYGNHTQWLRDEMPIIKNPTLTLDLTGISEQYIALGAKDTEDNFYTYGIDTGLYYDTGTLYARRTGAQEFNLTTENGSFTSAYRGQLYDVAIKNRQGDALESVTGTITVMEAGNTVLEDEIALGNCRTLEIFGRQIKIYITNMTYVKDTGGFTINCDYGLSYQS